MEAKAEFEKYNAAIKLLLESDTEFSNKNRALKIELDKRINRISSTAGYWDLIKFLSSKTHSKNFPAFKIAEKIVELIKNLFNYELANAHFNRIANELNDELKKICRDMINSIKHDEDIKEKNQIAIQYYKNVFDNLLKSRSINAISLDLSAIQHSPGYENANKTIKTYIDTRLKELTSYLTNLETEKSNTAKANFVSSTTYIQNTLHTKFLQANSMPKSTALPSTKSTPSFNPQKTATTSILNKVTSKNASIAPTKTTPPEQLASLSSKPMAERKKIVIPAIFQELDNKASNSANKSPKTRKQTPANSTIKKR